MTLEKKATNPNASHTTKMVDYKKSTKQCLDVFDGKTTRLCYVFETLKEKVKTAKEEIEAMTDVIAILPGSAVGNGQAPAQKYAPRLRNPELHAYGRHATRRKLKNSCLIWNNNFLPLI
ncbi:Uncharacterized protein Adt_45794 [Abeliophyllum distichum]|uniref:Uncharacterized protein n=1 Tax=Abeliophyllum distichum TaxID=126358 RepID=A0ABD1NN88_9LAMI